MFLFSTAPRLIFGSRGWYLLMTKLYTKEEAFFMEDVALVVNKWAAWVKKPKKQKKKNHFEKISYIFPKLDLGTFKYDS